MMKYVGFIFYLDFLIPLDDSVLDNLYSTLNNFLVVFITTGAITEVRQY